MEFCLIDSQSTYYPQVLDLRQRVLRAPLGLNLFDEDLAAEHDQYTLVARQHEKIIACLMLKMIEPSIIKLRQMAVDETQQGKGIGSLLMGYAENFCKLNGYQLIELHARKSAIQFYIKLNYQLIGNEFEEVGVPHYRMEKRLA
ncbi:MAG: GNAT family N-acetyltransferase [Bacteroidetes bacterium]|nr:GNAT family N-acetyltransferase [Bacteroidota bacterium]